MSNIQHCRRCGTAVVHRLPDDGDTRTRAICPSCHTVHYENPLNVVGTVPFWGERGEQVLLCKRNIEPRHGFWTLPAGFMEYGETPERCAVREMEEETGLLVRLTGLFGVYAGMDDPRSRAVLILYTARREGGRLRAGDDAQAAKWFAPARLPRAIAFAAHRQALQEYFGRH